MNEHDLEINPDNTAFFLLLASVLTLLFTASYLMRPAQVLEEKVVSEVALIDHFQDLKLTAKAAYVYDIRSGQVLYAHNEHERLPLASLTKVMAALVATEMVRPETTIVITPEALEALGDQGLRRGERWSLKKLLDFTLTSSSNDGMQAVALSLGALSKSDATSKERESSFLLEMNKKAEALGMQNTYFWNTTGLDETEYKGGAYGSAYDMALMFEYILRQHPTLLEATRYGSVSVTSLDNNVHTVRNTGLTITDLPGLRASKTGYTAIAGGNLVIAFDPEIGRPIIVSVLGSTANDRFRDVRTLVETTFSQVNVDALAQELNADNYQQ
jgi:serine-type D-Ala-D-Ala carboxypeptidase (penicillin-binding protein 5/6)